jgi:predicted regulator of Ras-like GTPase activity (Roadblock/LC7/MglB family)
MATSTTEKIQETLRKLRSTSAEIVGACVVSTDGFIVASLLPAEVDEEVVSAMAAAMLGVSERIALELRNSPMQQTYVKTDNGYILINAVGADSLLVVLTTENAKLGLIFLDVKRRVAELEDLVSRL